MTISKLAQCLIPRPWLLVGTVFAAALIAPLVLARNPADPEVADLPLASNLRKASINGKYAMLLHQISVPRDRLKHSDFFDAGRREVQVYAGQKNLSPGFWVYVSPYWYIWRDLVGEPKAKRPWGVEQATGEPDTPGAGDIQSAWASGTPDGSDEWLLLEYEEPVAPRAVFVHETCSPGSLYKITAMRLSGEEVEVWQGKDPTPVGSPRGISEIPLRIPFKTNRIKLFFHSKDVPGYNEIDAVGLEDASGKMQWARAATASSCYADMQGKAAAAQMPVAGGGPVVIGPGVPAPANNAQEQRIKKLEDEIKQLKEDIRKLQRLIEKQNKQ